MGTTRCCPRSSTSFPTRGDTTNTMNAITDDTKPAVRMEYPARVSMLTVPMFIMYP